VSEAAGVHRRPRFRRHRFAKPQFALQPRDIEIIRLVAAYRLLASDQICALVGGSYQNLLRRMQLLYLGGFLDRPRFQTLRSNEKLIYALGKAGAALLAADDAGNRRWFGDWAEKNRQIRSPQIEHQMMISRFRSQLTLAGRANGVEISRWLPDGTVRESVSIETNREPINVPVCPDAVLTLTLLNEREGSNRVHVCLECDRSTMTTARFLLKARGYWHWWRSGQQTEQIAAHNFLVVTVTQSEERARNLAKAVAELDAPRHRGLRMFLFGCEREYVNEKYRAVLGPMWGSPADWKWHTLLE
jgi:hypothetical protein